MVILFLVLVLMSFSRDSSIFAAFAIIVAVILGAMITADGVEIKQGVNSTLSADNRTVTNTDIYEKIDSKFNTAFAIVFFVLALWLGAVLITSAGKKG